MHRKIPGLRLLPILFALAVTIASFGAVPQAAPAQVRIPAEALRSDDQLQAVLQQGQLLESQRRWGEALSHYEDALREYPGRNDLQERLTQARIRFDLSRRYADSSFTRAASNLTEREALDLYSEVLTKVNTYYVLATDWRGMVRRGALALDVALSEPPFAQRHLRNVSSERIEAFRRRLRAETNGRAVRNPTEARQAVTAAARLAQQHLGVPATAVILEYACGAAGGLDTYSTYLTAAQLDDVYSQIEGNFVGLGIELKAEDGALLIVHVIPGSPAQAAAIRAGDRIVDVDGQSTREVSTDTAADMLKGEIGSVVSLGVQSPGAAPRRRRIRRERVEVPSVEDAKLADKDTGIAYLRITSFQKTTSRDVDAALWKLHRAGMRSLIVDVRGNPGGLLTASVEVADKFLNSGTVVSTRGRSAREDFDYKAHRVGTWGVPLVVLIDGDTASASEIFAGAIRDHRRGTIVGQTSYGKGSVQGIFPLNRSKSGVRLTTAKFYSPSGKPISKRGVSPDILVHITAKTPAEGGTATPTDDDPTLAAGMQAARRYVSQR